MAIAHVQLWWLERLFHLGVFRGKRSILEIGPQDLFYPTLPALANFVTSVTGVPCSELEISRRFFKDAPIEMKATREYLEATHALYEVLGLTEYSSTDLYDIRADYHFDLNYPIELGRKFDIITQFGTLEHVFNIGNAVEFIHDHLEVGGIVLHGMPTRGNYNHGFYNLHSTWYRDMAAANHYEVVDFVYLPDVSRRNTFLAENESFGDRPPLQLFFDVDLCEGEVRGDAFNFANPKPPPQSADVDVDVDIADHIYAALRKTSDAEFRYPQQTIWGLPGGGPIRSDDADEHVAAGLSHFAAKRWPEAGAEARTAIRVRSDHAGAWHLIGAVALATGYLADAVKMLAKACEIAPQDAEALKDYGIALHVLDRPDDAISRFREAAKLKPGMIDAYQGALGSLGVLHSRDPRNRDVLVEHLWAYRGLARAYASAGDFQAEITTLRSVIVVLSQLKHIDPTDSAIDDEIKDASDQIEARQKQGNML